MRISSLTCRKFTPRQAPLVPHQRRSRSRQDRSRQDAPLSGVFRRVHCDPRRGEHHRPLDREKRQHVARPGTGQVGTMYSDITKVRQSLLNLLSNACKFTKKGPITLTVTGRPVRTRSGSASRYAIWALACSRADTSAVPTLFASRRLDHAAVWGQPARPDDYPALLPYAGRYYHSRECPWRGSTFTIRLPAAASQ